MEGAKEAPSFPSLSGKRGPTKIDVRSDRHSPLFRRENSQETHTLSFRKKRRLSQQKKERDTNSGAKEREKRGGKKGGGMGGRGSGTSDVTPLKEKGGSGQHLRALEEKKGRARVQKNGWRL